MKVLSRVSAVLLALFCVAASAQTSAPGYDVVLLVGQSNMVGLGTGPDNAADAAVSPRVFMWDAINNAIVPAVDPLVQNQVGVDVGLGLTFAKSYAASIPGNRNVLLVGSAQGATTFGSGRWVAPAGDLVTTAVSRANAAMTAAGPGARFAGILWHQGESDLAGGTPISTYAADLVSLFTFFRQNIQGASASTPVVIGEWTYPWMSYIVSGANSNTALQLQYISFFHSLPDVLNNSAWVGTGGLASDALNGTVHFSALSQRQLGRRYADRFFLASLGVPQPETSQVSWAGYFFDDGRSYANNIIPVNFLGLTNGSVNIVADAARGNVAQFSSGNGSLSYYVPASTFNGDYTKMVWFKPGAPGYLNNLISGLNPGQGHFLLAYSGAGVVTILAGHSNGNSTPILISAVANAPASVWMNICLQYSAATHTAKLYVNGAPVASASNVAPAPALTGNPVPFTIGAYGNIAGTGTDGSIAGSRVWTSALTDAQIKAIYNYDLSYRAGW